MTGQRIVSWVGVLAGLAVVVGVLGSLVWARMVHLPVYVIGPDHVAVMTERGHSELFASDAWFVAIGLVGGLVLGGLAWSWFRSLGWPVVLIALGAGLVAGLVCREIGQLWGPGPLDVRLDHANPGDTVPAAFQLHSPAALAAWAMAAVLPTLLASALGPELSPHGDAGPRGRAAVSPEPAPIDQDA